VYGVLAVGDTGESVAGNNVHEEHHDGLHYI
jgi:hypothetical protein